MAAKRENFRRLSEPRLEKAIEAIRLVGNLSDRGRYEYDEAEAERLLREMRKAVSHCSARFRVEQGKKK